MGSASLPLHSFRPPTSSAPDSYASAPLAAYRGAHGPASFQTSGVRVAADPNDDDFCSACGWPLGLQLLSVRAALSIDVPAPASFGIVSAWAMRGCMGDWRAGRGGTGPVGSDSPDPDPFPSDPVIQGADPATRDVTLSTVAIWSPCIWPAAAAAAADSGSTSHATSLNRQLSHTTRSNRALSHPAYCTQA